MKNYILTSIIMVLGVLFIYGCTDDGEDNEHNTQNKSETGFGLTEDNHSFKFNDLTFSMNDNFDIIFNEETTKDWGHAEDYIYTYNIEHDGNHVANLKVTNRTFEEGGILFTEIKEEGSPDVTFDLTYDVDIDDAWHSFDELDYTFNHNPTVGVDPLKGPSTLLNSEEGSYLFGRGTLSHDTTEEYEEGNQSQVRVLDEMLEEESLDPIEYEWNFDGKAEQFQTWVMYSDEKLIEDEAYIDEIKTDMVENYRRYQKWLTPDGIYAKLPWSVKPFDEMGYGRNIGYQFRSEHRKQYHKKEELYDVLFMRNMITSIEVIKDDFPSYDLPPTEYTSSWLQQPYGLQAPYLDTRHLSGLGLFYLNMMEIFEVDYMDEYLLYADYLVESLDDPSNSFSVGNDYRLIGDYDGPGLTEIPHASLNHVLAEIHYLMKAYFETDDTTYLDAAHDMRSAVEEIGTDWIREEGEYAGDLWYQINSDLTFSGNDYACLTLEDLHFAQEDFAQTEYGKSDMLETLYESKLNSGVCDNAPHLSD
ncbi:hypothetical protein ABID56_001180 [Alkalibacillus flavidus]|uniref:D-glucuronyl C5-epimerase C-terminal domain-containing protein n=1 Tax=Alkalibacillus flavidus TaxID=546021 RepID=A0ABV2KU31_9BACI